MSHSVATTNGTARTAPPPPPRAVARRTGGAVVLLILLAAALLLSVLIGSHMLSPSQLWYGLTHHYTAAPDANNQAAIILQTQRLPRTLIGLLVGAALGVAGALAQGFTRNPLAEPGLLGVTNGAGIAIVLAITFASLDSPLPLVWLGMGGAFLATILVFAVSSIGRGGANPLTLIIAGWSISTFLYAWTVAFSLSNQVTIDALRKWMVGSLGASTWNQFWTIVGFIGCGLIVAFAAAPTLNALSLGDDVARGLGTNVWRARLHGIVAITVLAGAATAACGPISLLGLMTPHLVRLVTGANYKWLLPYCALLGATILLLCDVAGRLMVSSELPAGVVVAIIGAPFFIALVRYRSFGRS